jgi:hypothetical protein
MVVEFSPWQATASAWNYWSCNSKAVNACLREFSPTVID